MYTTNEQCDKQIDFSRDSAYLFCYAASFTTLQNQLNFIMKFISIISTFLAQKSLVNFFNFNHRITHWIWFGQLFMINILTFCNWHYNIIIMNTFILQLNNFYLIFFTNKNYFHWRAWWNENVRFCLKKKGFRYKNIFLILFLLSNSRLLIIICYFIKGFANTWYYLIHLII